MEECRTVFAQIMDFVPRYEFDKCVRRYNGNRRVKSFTCYDQFLTMAFAQLSGRESLREIVSCLSAVRNKLYHSGFSGEVSRSTLADANENRDWRIYQDFGYHLIKIAQASCRDEALKVRLKSTVYALDSTTIDLCMELFPWAKFRSTKSAVKMHTLLDLRGNIPSFIGISNGRDHDVKFLDELPKEAGSFYIMDRAYNDFERLFEFEKERSYFVIRSKKNLSFSWKRSRPVDKMKAIKSDQEIVLKSELSRSKYPNRLRRISFYDEEQNRKLVFLTNNFTLAPVTIANLYKSRWQVELFFKWIKQHLKIKKFYGTSENAVKIQIWISISCYLLVAIARQRLGVTDRSLFEILQIVDILIFEKTPILEALSPSEKEKKNDVIGNQLLLFDS
jgi:hypothetical protein